MFIPPSVEILTVRILRPILHLYTYLFLAFLALFLLGIAIVGSLAGTSSIDLGVLPWTGSRLLRALFIYNGFGLLAVILAVRGKARILLPIYASAVVFHIFRGYYWAPYGYDGMDHFKSVLWLTLAAVVAFLGAISQWRAAASPRRR